MLKYMNMNMIYKRLVSAVSKNTDFFPLQG